MQKEIVCKDCVPLDLILMEQEAPIRNSILDAKTKSGYGPTYAKQLGRLKGIKILPKDGEFHVFDSYSRHIPCKIAPGVNFDTDVFKDGLYTLNIKSFNDEEAYFTIWKLE